MKQTVQRGYAKINLGLDVVGRRPDGYHIVRMIMQTVDLYDTLTFSLNHSGEIRLFVETDAVSGARLPERAAADADCVPAGEENLVWRAAALLRSRFHIAEGVDIRLNKRIPVAAGMAGGSTDAAAALRGMNELFRLGLSQEALRDAGAALGADVPFCVTGGTALAEGIGERLTPLCDMPDCRLVIGKPAAAVSTRQVYEALDAHGKQRCPDIDGLRTAIEKRDLRAAAAQMENVLEGITAKAHPVIGEIEALLEKRGAMRAMMSGSGPTVFGVFAEEALAETAYAVLSESGLCRQTFLSVPVRPRYEGADTAYGREAR